jgi:thymidylate synthase ThyX
VNRLLEPFQHITVVVTSTEWSNFFALRCHPDAQPEIKVLAEAMYVQYSASTPKSLLSGEWHLPFIPDTWDFRTSTIEECKYYPFELTNGLTATDLLIRRSVARCARVSYLNHDGTAPSLEKDLELYNRLVAGTPMHASPTEHQAMAIPNAEMRSGNFVGWIQYRKTLANENITTFGGV